MAGYRHTGESELMYRQSVKVCEDADGNRFSCNHATPEGRDMGTNNIVIYRAAAEGRQRQLATVAQLILITDRRCAVRHPFADEGV